MPAILEQFDRVATIMSADLGFGQMIAFLPALCAGSDQQESVKMRLGCSASVRSSTAEALKNGDTSAR